MKKFFYYLILLCCLCIPAFAQSRAGDRVFDVRAFGAVGNCTAAGALGSCTNDVAALRKAMAAANANGGGVVYFPNTATNAYYVLVGDPATDVNLTNIDPNHYAIFNITSNNVTFRFARGVTLRVVSSHLYQTNAGGGAIPGQTALFWFGNQVTIMENFQLDGEYPTLSFELASPAAYFTGNDSANGFLLQSGKTKRAHWKRFYVTGFPQGGLIDGYTSGSDQLTDAIYEDMRVLEYGSGGDDLWFYTYGNTTFLRCWFFTSRKSSHGVYSGSDKPGVKIKGCWFNGQDESAALNNKFGIQIYQTSGTSPIREWEITDNLFYNVRNAIWIQHNGGYEARNIVIKNNRFIRSGSTATGAGIQAYYPRDCDFSNNYFQTLVTGISVVSPGIGTYTHIDGNDFLDCTTGVSAYVNNSSVSNNHYNRTSIASSGATRFSIQGARNRIIANDITDGGSSAGSPIALIANGANNLVSKNVIYATASQGYSIIFQIISSGGEFSDNKIIHTGASGYSDLSGDGILVAGNNSNKLVTVNGTGSVFSTVVGNTLSSSAQIRLTGKCRANSNDVTGGWETITGAYAGSNNLTNSAALDSITVTTSGTYVPHVGVYSAFLITANGNLTISTPTNPTGGQRVVVVVLQDAIGGRTVSFSSDWVASGAVTTTANTRTSWTFVYDASVSKFIQCSFVTGI